MGTLYIIGNGFDLHWKLNTTTDDFIDFLQGQRIEGEMDNAVEVLARYGVNWSEYEQALADIDLDTLEEENLGFPDYMSDRESDRDGVIYNMQTYLDSIQEAVRSALKEMVEAANDDLEDVKIPRKIRQMFHSGDAILSFNYTSTIEELFDLPDDIEILHIHGFYQDDDPLIFGYGKAKGRYRAKLIPDEDSDYYVDRQREAVLDFYQALKKDYKMDELNHFLRSCRNIDRVVVYGHSMGEVDAQYMERIEQVLAPSSWEVSYHGKLRSARRTVKNYTFYHKTTFFKF